jgi:AcrR family transcriptional regulator
MAAPTKPGRRGPRRALSEQEILDAALSLLDEGGVEATSVRGIAARVGVAPNAVYTYFPDKAAVLRALVERLLGEVDHGVFADRSEAWRQRVHSLALELRNLLVAHPGAVNLMLGGPMDGPHALALGERLLEVLADAGLDPPNAARASYLLIVYILGAIALEVAELDSPGAPPPEPERIAARRAGLALIAADSFPRTAAVTDTMAAYVSTEQFRWGLDRVLDGIASAPARANGRSGRRIPPPTTSTSE